MAELDRDNFGFTLVELMVVVLIVGILVSVAIPVFQNAVANARAAACQANQRTISGVVALYQSNEGRTVTASEGVLEPGGSGWYAILIPHWVNGVPKCPSTGLPYLVDGSGRLLGDRGLVAGFVPLHSVP